MVLRAKKFTPQVLLSTPRISAGVPNSDGSKVLYSSTTYSFDDHKNSHNLFLLDTSTSESTSLTTEEDISDFTWLSGEKDTFVCLKKAKEGCTDVVVCNAATANAWETAVVAGQIPAPANNLKVASLENGKYYGIVLSAQANPDGSFHNPETAPKVQSTGRLYKDIWIRHWDYYLGKERNSLWYGTLGRHGKWQLSEMVNALKGTGIECPKAPEGGAECFDVSARGIMFVAKDPTLNPALNTKDNAYLLKLTTFEEAPQTLHPLPLPPNYAGAMTSPVYSSDGKMGAFLTMKKNGYEADRNEIVSVFEGRQEAQIASELRTTNDDVYDLSPRDICVGADASKLYMTADDQGYGRLYELQMESGFEVRAIRMTTEGNVIDVKPLANGNIFITRSSLTESSSFAILEPGKAARESEITLWTHSFTRGGSSLGLDQSQVSSIWFPASDPSVNKEVHAWVVKPSNYDKSKKYPLAMLVHGGPQGAWTDSWSTRWNPPVFAEQGYIVVAPNVVGSTGYGQAFTDRIRKDWGGAPYEDIVNCFNYVSDNMSDVDIDRAVALGASYGGFMMNWIEGHPLGKKFKALVCHDGVFSMGGQLASDELYFPFHDMGGLPFYSGSDSSNTKVEPIQAQAEALYGKTSLEAWNKNDPSKYLENWTTPMLVIHSSKDYRLTMAEGLATFNVLRTRGIDSQMLHFPDENHFVLNPENSLVWHKAILNWINKYAGLPAFSDEDEESEQYYGGVKVPEEKPSTA